jgi:uncharacterized protein YdeI (YjbR/CyaY-like superfamily)
MFLRFFRKEWESTFLEENILKSDLPIFLFENQTAWEVWLQLNHSHQAGARLKLAKKGSGLTTISYEEAVESALCYGWIDSQAASYDRHYYLQKFSPRRAKSKWSILNREKAEALIATGRMQPAGLEQIAMAKADGRWEAAYDPQSRITIPEDLQKELEQNQAASDFFDSLNSINRYAILHRIQDAKKSETRFARIRKYVDMLANKQKIYP